MLLRCDDDIHKCSLLNELILSLTKHTKYTKNDLFSWMKNNNIFNKILYYELTNQHEIHTINQLKLLTQNEVVLILNDINDEKSDNETFINEWKKLQIQKLDETSSTFTFDLTKLFNQFCHLKFEHCNNNKQFDEIYIYFKQQIYDNNGCDNNECLYIFNHYRDRCIEVNNHISNNNNDNTRIIDDMMSRIHCFIFHSYEINRLTPYEMSDINKQLFSKNEHIDKNLKNEMMFNKMLKKQLTLNNTINKMDHENAIPYYFNNEINTNEDNENDNNTNDNVILPDKIEDCDTNNIIYMLKQELNDKSRYKNVSKYQNELIKYFEDNQIDGQKIMNMSGKKLRIKICKYLNDKKTGGNLSKLISSIKKNQFKQVNEKQTKRKKEDDKKSLMTSATEEQQKSLIKNDEDDDKDDEKGTMTVHNSTSANLQQWMCGQCTLINEISSMKCTSCNKIRPSLIQ